MRGGGLLGALGPLPRAGGGGVGRGASSLSLGGLSLSGGLSGGGAVALTLGGAPAAAGEGKCRNRERQGRPGARGLGEGR